MKYLYKTLLILTIVIGTNNINAQGYIGDIKMFAGNFAPNGWALCNGQLLPINQNQALFSILGTTYGGDGETTFALPDLRGRVPVHAGNGPGLTPKILGEKSGTENTTLSTSNVPPHSHTVAPNANSDLGTTNLPTDNYPANTSILDKEYSETTNETLGSTTTSSVGNGNSFSNEQPYGVIHYIICMQGIFPSPN